MLLFFIGCCMLCPLDGVKKSFFTYLVLCTNLPFFSLIYNPCTHHQVKPMVTPTHILLVHNVVIPRLLHLVEVYYVEMVGEDIVVAVL